MTERTITRTERVASMVDKEYSIKKKVFTVDGRFTSFNLTAHQSINPVNIDVIKDYVTENMEASFARSETLDFLNELLDQSAKLQHALKQVEKGIEVCGTLDID